MTEAERKLLLAIAKAVADLLVRADDDPEWSDRSIREQAAELDALAFDVERESDA